MKYVAVCFAVLAAVSCVSAPKTVTLPDGTVARMAYCDGATNTFAACYNYAASQCPGGKYKVHKEDAEASITANIPRREVAFTCS